MAKRARALKNQGAKTRRATKGRAGRRGAKAALDTSDTFTINKGEMAKQASRPGLREDKLPVNDKLEGVIRDAVMYKGQPVSYVKDIGVHDISEYDPHVRKVVLHTADGETLVVPAAELNVEVTPPVVPQMRPKRVPELTFPKGHPGNLAPEHGR